MMALRIRALIQRSATLQQAHENMILTKRIFYIFLPQEPTYDIFIVLSPMW